MASIPAEPKLVISCAVCSADVPWFGRGRTPRYCGSSCKARAVRRGDKPVDPQRYELVCAQCSSSFPSSRSHARFCSPGCRAKAHYESRKGSEPFVSYRARVVARVREERMVARAARPPATCQQCGAQFRVRGEYVRPFCTQRCRSRAEYAAALASGAAAAKKAARQERAAARQRACVRCGKLLRYARKDAPHCRGCLRYRKSRVRIEAERRAKKAARGRRPSAHPFVAGCCVRCGAAFVARPNGTLSQHCTRECRLADARDRRRALEAGVKITKVRRRRLYERDEWVCHLCGESVDPELAVPDPGAATLDHVVPLAAGGDHSEENLRLAHFICNSRKGASILADTPSSAAGLVVQETVVVQS